MTRTMFVKTDVFVFSSHSHSLVFPTRTHIGYFSISVTPPPLPSHSHSQSLSLRPPPTLCIFLSSLLPLSLSPTSSLTHSLSHFPSLSSFPRTHIVYFSISVTPPLSHTPFLTSPSLYLSVSLSRLLYFASAFSICHHSTFHLLKRVHIIQLQTTFIPTRLKPIKRDLRFINIYSGPVGLS